jgi:hypothetical protein
VPAAAGKGVAPDENSSIDTDTHLLHHQDRPDIRTNKSR